MPSLDPFEDSGETLEIDVIATMSDSAGRRWAFVEERRYALVLMAGSEPGDEMMLRPDVVDVG